MSIVTDPTGYSRYSHGRCARCQAPELYRSRPRTVFERAVSLLTPWQPLRCPACGMRELRLGSAAERRLPTPVHQAIPTSHSDRRPRRRHAWARGNNWKRTVLVTSGAAALAAALGAMVGSW